MAFIRLDAKFHLSLSIQFKLIQYWSIFELICMAWILVEEFEYKSLSHRGLTTKPYCWQYIGSVDGSGIAILVNYIQCIKQLTPQRPVKNTCHLHQASHIYYTWIWSFANYGTNQELWYSSAHNNYTSKEQSTIKHKWNVITHVAKSLHCSNNFL